MEPSKKVIFIKDWILNYVNSMPVKAKSLVIGISGGIDSSLKALTTNITPSNFWISCKFFFLVGLVARKLFFYT